MLGSASLNAVRCTFSRVSISTRANFLLCPIRVLRKQLRYRSRSWVTGVGALPRRPQNLRCRQASPRVPESTSSGRYNTPSHPVCLVPPPSFIPSGSALHSFLVLWQVLDCSSTFSRSFLVTSIRLLWSTLTVTGISFIIVLSSNLLDHIQQTT